MGRTPSPSERVPFTPSEDWIDQFKAQCTQKLRVDMKHYARWRARSVRRAAGFLDETYAEEVVAQILADTLGGVVTWDPGRKSLYQHAEDMVRRRTFHDRKRAERFRHERIDAPIGVAERSTRAMVEASLAQDQDDISVDDAIQASQAMARLRALVGRDGEMHAYLDAMVAGARDAREIMEHTKMSHQTFRNARDRLTRLAKRIEIDETERGARA